MADLCKRAEFGRDVQIRRARLGYLFLCWLAFGVHSGSFRDLTAGEPVPKKVASTLESCLTPLIVAHKGKVAVAVKHLGDR